MTTHSARLLKAIALGFAVSISCANAAVTFSGNAATNVRDELGVLLPVNSLVLIVADTGAAGFGAALAGQLNGGESLAEDAFLVGDRIVQRNSSGNVFGTITAPGTLTENLTTSVPAGTIAPGTPFAVYWFTQPNSSTTATIGEFFGVATHPSWVFPADGSAFTFTTGTLGSTNFATVQNAGNATLPIGVPEPSRVLLTMGALLGLLTRRRRSLF